MGLIPWYTFRGVPGFTLRKLETGGKGEEGTRASGNPPHGLTLIHVPGQCRFRMPVVLRRIQRIWVLPAVRRELPSAVDHFR